MGPRSRREYLQKIQQRYKRASKEEKTQILDEFCQVCEHHRKHAIRVLNAPRLRPRRKPGRKSRYGPEIVAVLKAIWLAGEQMCSKRLKAALPLWLPYYESLNGPLAPSSRELVLGISPATIDRLLASARFRYGRRGLSGTKPGTLLRNQIPVRTEHWDVDRPGYFEADTVAHCGDSLKGNFIWSLTFTDIWSGWTEMRAVWNKGAQGVVEATRNIEKRLPFAILGFDCDNGSEFLNHHLWTYFANRPEPVHFTRSRPYHSNDNAHVEQKQWTHVRQLLGYRRLENAALLNPINELYASEWALMQNYFLPSMKLKTKEKINSRYRRRYEPPRTPYERLLESPHVSNEAKLRLQHTFRQLNPFLLKKAIERKLKRIFALQPRLHEPPEVVDSSDHATDEIEVETQKAPACKTRENAPHETLRQAAHARHT